MIQLRCSSLYLAFLILFGACYNKSGKIIHPTKENTPDTDLENVRLINEKSSEIKAENLSKQLRNLRIEKVINEIEGEYSNQFGFITDVEVDKFNRIYILDERRQDVNVFSDEGNFITTIGGKGAGPGETESAKSISVYNNEWLLINNFNRIEIYTITENDIKFLKTITFDKPVSNLCVIGEKLYTYSPISIANYSDSDDKSFPIIHAYIMPEMEHLFSFGESYKSENLPIVSQLSFGEMSCNENSSTVIFKFDRFPFLYGYSSTDGSLKWVNVFNELQIPIVEETNRGGQIGLGFNPEDNEFRDSILRTKTLNDSYQLVQVDRRIIPKKGNFISESKVLSFIIDTNTGESAYIGEDLPRIVGTSENFLIGVNSDYVEALILK